MVHDDENEWIVQDGMSDPCAPGASIICHILHLTEADPAVASVASLPMGHVAWRKAADDPWTIEPWSHEDE
ncbi:hypothetical protein KRM28CT15_04010 [Krasilnikovia sp. M28-CT-15]